MKRVVNISLWIISFAGLFFLLGFVGNEHGKVLCKQLAINIHDDGNNLFLEETDISEIIFDSGDSIVGSLLSAINTAGLEKRIDNNPYVEKSEFYITIDGVARVDVMLRKPLLRIIDFNDQSYYLDDRGRFMPLSDKYTSRVLVANGYIHAPYGLDITREDAMDTVDVLARSRVLNDLYFIATAIAGDPFWKTQVEQVYVNDNKEYELIPRIGHHTILLGSVDRLYEKLDKLLVLYRQGLGRTGWNQYKLINLKYNNQIVCTKR